LPYCSFTFKQKRAFLFEAVTHHRQILGVCHPQPFEMQTARCGQCTPSVKVFPRNGRFIDRRLQHDIEMLLDKFSAEVGTAPHSNKPYPLNITPVQLNS
jgi:hypothetical protein